MPSTSTFRADVATAAITGYTPTEEDLRGLAEWWDTYDALAERAAIEEMADLGVFPMNLVTDDAGHQPVTDQWDRGRYVATMSQVMGGGEGTTADEVATVCDSTRTPLFLGPSIAVVFSRSTMTAGGESYQLDYADVLVRDSGGWRFQTMIQPGWAEVMSQLPG